MEEAQGAAAAVQRVGARVGVAHGMEPEHERRAAVAGEAPDPVEETAHDAHRTFDILCG